jgi:hypothetical protein
VEHTKEAALQYPIVLFIISLTRTDIMHKFLLNLPRSSQTPNLFQTLWTMLVVQ